ncbi:MAG TPA: nickel ABC transporter permease [Patescibacteria group bacterium]|nr:nickel ABC transporter permease [Patescibacteria group bacterium]
MLTFIRRRILLAVPVIVGVSVVVFSIIHLLPGDPVLAILSGANATPEQERELRAQLRLDDPLPLQYVRFLARAAAGDFGRSIFTRRPVMEEIADQLPSTLELAGTAILIAVVVGVVLGVLAAVRHNTWIDRAAMLVALGGVSMPSFWLGLLLIFVFSLQLGWLPATGQGGVSRLILPAATIGLNYSAVIARLVRSSLLEVLGNNYISTARAKGLSEWGVTLKHALGNALIPVTTIIGVQLGNLLAGTIIVETVFSRRGMGRLAVTAVLDKDYPLIQGVVLVSALGYVLTNLLVDLSYSALDPRIRHRDAAEA